MGLEQRVFFVSGHASNLELFCIETPTFAISINHIVYLLVVSVKNRHPERAFPYEHLFGNLHDLHDSVLADDDHIVQIGTFLNRFILFEPIAGKPVFSVQEKSFVRNHDLGRNNFIERSQFSIVIPANLSFALPAFSILFLQFLEITDRIAL